MVYPIYIIYNMITNNKYLGTYVVGTYGTIIWIIIILSKYINNTHNYHINYYRLKHIIY